MGANVSTSVASATSIIKNTQSASCTNASSIIQGIKGLDIQIEGASCGDITVRNTATVQQTCDLSAMASALAEAASQMSAEQKAALSLSANISTQVQDNKQIIESELNLKCGNESAILQSIEGVKFTVKPYVYVDPVTKKTVVVPASCNTATFANEASAQQQCALKMVTDAISKTDTTQTAVQTQESIISGLISGLMLPLLIGGGLLIAPIIIIVIVKMLKKPTTPVDLGPEMGAVGTEAANTELPVYQDYVDVQKGGARRRSRGSNVNTQNIPIVVLGILMLVWYSKTTDLLRGRRIPN